MIRYKIKEHREYVISLNLQHVGTFQILRRFLFLWCAIGAAWNLEDAIEVLHAHKKIKREEWSDRIVHKE